MRRVMIMGACCLFVSMLLPPDASAKKTQVRDISRYQIQESSLPPANPPDIQQAAQTMYPSAIAETTLLGWWQFDTAEGTPDEQGWTALDLTTQLDTFFHVDGGAGGGPDCCPITPVSGERSMWCGQCPSTDPPYCSWATLPGYGNLWDQRLESRTFSCTTLTFSYTVVWDSEPGYDMTTAEYWDDAAQDWVILPVNGGAGYYDGAGGPLSENFVIDPPNDTTKLRFRFVSDSGWDDRDGLWDTDEGAIKVDDIGVLCEDVGGTTAYFEDWEDETCGDKRSNDMVWYASVMPSFGVYAALHSGASVVQEDPCVRLISNLWGFFDDPAVTNYGCGGWPFQGAVPYGPDENGLYMDNAIWSPKIPYVGSGDEVRFTFRLYGDLKIDPSIYYMWHIREWVDDCPTSWENVAFVDYAPREEWYHRVLSVGRFVEPNATYLQLWISAVDMCWAWCGIYGTGECHSHGPLIDQVRLVRVETFGPQWFVRHIDLFNDNFPEDGLATCQSYARADMALDMLPNSNPSIIPGDSAVVDVKDPSFVYTPLNPPDDDPDTSIPPQVYCWVRVGSHLCTPGHTPQSIESPDQLRYPGAVPIVPTRYPFTGNTMTCGPWTYWQYQCDFAFGAPGYVISDRYCIDLMDIANGLHTVEDQGLNTGAFVPGDTIYYFFEAVPNSGPPTYWHRQKAFRLGQEASNATLSWDEACHQPCEFMILPDAGRLPEGDILFVDDADDRGGPAELYFDLSFENLNMMDLGGERRKGPFYSAFTSLVDIFDVIGPSSCVGNSLASRVVNINSQLIDPYQKILWNSSNLTRGLLGDGGAPNGGSSYEKSDDWALLNSFLTDDPGDPGVYVSGDNLAEDWVTLTGAGAIAARSTYMNFNLLSGDHVAWGEPVSPAVWSGDPGANPVFDPPQSANGPDTLIAFGGCPAINDFDVLQATGLSKLEMKYPNAGDAAVLAQPTPTAQTTARFVLSGFAYDFIRETTLPTQPTPARVEHLRDILSWFENDIAEPVGIDPIAFENRLENNYPNPFNPTTTIRYEIKERAQVTLKVYNVAGQLVRTLLDEVQTPREGGFAKEWDGTNDQGQPVSSGVYFYKLTTKGFSQTKKMVLLK